MSKATIKRVLSEGSLETLLGGLADLQWMSVDHEADY